MHLARYCADGRIVISSLSFASEITGKFPRARTSAGCRVARDSQRTAHESVWQRISLRFAGASYCSQRHANSSRRWLDVAYGQERTVLLRHKISIDVNNFVQGIPMDGLCGGYNLLQSPEANARADYSKAPSNIRLTRAHADF